MAIAGCGGSKNTSSVENKDRQRIIAEVNGEKILMGELIDNFEQDKLFYGVTQEDERKPENKEVIRQLKSNILEELIYGRIASQRAKQAGYRIDSGTIEEARKEFEGFIIGIAEQMKAEDNSSSDIDYIKKAREYVDNELKKAGRTEEENVSIMAGQKAIERFKSELLKDVHADEDYIAQYYDIQLEMQIHDPEGNSTRDIILYEPYEVTVKHILVALPDEMQNEYKKLKNEQKEAEAKHYLNEELKTIYPKSQDIYSKILKGESFEELLEFYGEDPGMKNNPKGYVVREDGKFAHEFEKGALMLKEGNVSPPIASSFGYHIIKAYKVKQEKVHTLEEKKEEIRKIADEYKRDERWSEILDCWAKESSIRKFPVE